MGQVLRGGEAKAVKGGAAHMLGSARPRERGPTQATTRVHRCACEGREGGGGSHPGARGRGHPGRRAREGKGCSDVMRKRQRSQPGGRKAAGIFATAMGLGLMVGPGRHRTDDGEQEETAGWAGRAWEALVRKGWRRGIRRKVRSIIGVFPPL